MPEIKSIEKNLQILGYNNDVATAPMNQHIKVFIDQTNNYKVKKKDLKMYIAKKERCLSNFTYGTVPYQFKHVKQFYHYKGIGAKAKILIENGDISSIQIADEAYGQNYRQGNLLKITILEVLNFVEETYQYLYLKIPRNGSYDNSSNFFNDNTGELNSNPFANSIAISSSFN